MRIDQSPTELIEENKYWLYATEVIDGERPTGDEHLTRDKYFSKYGVTHPQNLIKDDLPSADSNAVQELDREAFDTEKVGGKWHVSGSAETIEQFWPGIIDDVVEQRIWGAKAMTATGWDAHPGDDFMIIVYTPNYFEKHDVDRVRKHLRNEYDLTQELFYKPDLYSVKGIQPGSVEDWGLSMAYRYRE